MSEPIRGRRFESLHDLQREQMYGYAPAAAGEFAHDRLGATWYVYIGEADGGLGRLGPNHTVTEHDDGTITVEPSIVMHKGWHGWLRRGEFTRC